MIPSHADDIYFLGLLHRQRPANFDARLRESIRSNDRVSCGSVGRTLGSAMLRWFIRDLHFSVSKFVSNFETVSNVKILVVNSLNIWDTVL